MPQRIRTFLVWILLVVMFAAIYLALTSDGNHTRHESAAVYQSDLESGAIAWVGIDDAGLVHVTRVDGDTYATDLAYTDSVYDQLSVRGIPIQSTRASAGDDGHWTTIMMIAGIFIGLLAFLYFLRQRSGGVNSVFSLRRTTARLVSDVPKIGFDDVGGGADAKAYLRDTLDFMRNPVRWEKAGARLPRGVLLEGPPGFGKTMLAKALAGEARLPFFEVSGSEFVELFVGVGAARIRDLFDEAKKKAPCVVFIDELDAIGRKRGGSSASLTHQEREQALDQLLVCLDGFRPRERVVIVAATNRADVLDPALMRPGRFDVTLRIGDFTSDDRLAVLKVHTKNKPLSSDVDLESIAERTEGASGADLEQLCNTAALAAARRSGTDPRITRKDLDHALESRAPKSSQLDKLDLFLAEASGGIAQSAGGLMVRLRLRSGEEIQGRAAWADPMWIKIISEDDRQLISRAQIVSIEAHRDTSAIDHNDLGRVLAPAVPDAG